MHTRYTGAIQLQQDYSANWLTYVCNFTIFTGLHSLLADMLSDYSLSLSFVLVCLLI